MKIMLLSGFALLCTIAASAQTPAPQQPPRSPSTNTPQTVTLTGCVGSLAGTQGGFMLSNPIVMPPTGAAPAAQPGSPAATPPSTAQPPAPVGTAGAPPAGTAGVSPTGTAGTTPTGTPPPTGVPANPPSSTATPGTPPPAAAPGSIAAGAGTTAAMNGYRLSGADMSSWSGQRVQIVGTVVPGQTTPGAAAPTGATNPGATAPMPEFRVQSVQPVDGPCPK